MASIAVELLLFESVNGQMDNWTDRQNVITIAHPEHSSGELKKKKKRYTGSTTQPYFKKFKSHYLFYIFY